MKKLITILFIITVTGVFAQSPGYIDSLNQLVNNPSTQEDQKLHALLNLSFYINSPLQSLHYAQEAILISQATNNKIYEALAYGYAGNAHRSLGNTVKAIEATLNAAQIYQRLERSLEEGYTYTQIGNIYLNTDDLESCLKYYHQAFDIFKNNNDSTSMANVLNNIGEAYRLNQDPNQAILNYESALELLDQSNINNQNTELASTVKGNLGMIYLDENKTNQAELLLKNATEYFKNNNSFQKLSVYQCELGKLLIKKKEYKKGEKFILESLEIAKQNKLKEEVRDIHLTLCDHYEVQGKYKLALSHFKEYKNYYDSIQNVDNIRKLEQQTSKFEISKREDRINTLNRINNLQRILAIVLASGVCIFIVLLFYLFRNNQKIKTINTELSLQKKLIEQREEEKALLLRELNHRVKNNLQMVASLLNLHAKQLKDHPAAEALLSGKYRVEALTLIHQKLYRDDVDTKIDIKDYIEELTRNLVMNFGPDFKLELHLISLVMKIDKAIPLGLIINELVTNSLKYGNIENENPELGISITNKNNAIKLVIKDNGKGLPLDFDPSKSNSFGLKLVHSLVKQLYGQLEHTNQDGTKWTLILSTEKLN